MTLPFRPLSTPQKYAHPIHRHGFTLIEMLVVVSIVMILCTLIIATVVNALSELRAAGGASGVAGFVR
ncbi:MAG TPA: type II secretion system protein, partial [Planctomycetota bacterium]|nr:type II secretion system protein [Planctomycetota bacterium]